MEWGRRPTYSIPSSNSTFSTRENLNSNLTSVNTIFPHQSQGMSGLVQWGRVHFPCLVEAIKKSLITKQPNKFFN